MVVVTELVGGCHSQCWVGGGRDQTQHCTDGGDGDGGLLSVPTPGKQSVLEPARQNYMSESLE